MAIKSRLNLLLKPTLYHQKVKIMTGLGSSSSCGACKFLRRKCTSECLFAPYFCYDEAANHFAAVHKVFGASNVSKLLSHLPLHNRSDAATTISYEALARINNPIYGCVAHIIALQQQVAYLQEEIEVLGTQIANTLKSGVASNIITEANKYNQFSRSPLFTQNGDVLNVQQTQNQQAILIPNGENANVNNQTSSFEISAQCSGEEENIHFADPLDKLFEGIDQFNYRHYPWLDESTFGKY